ncbi:MAG: hypothetical protein AB8B91_06150 [Rubripirellula sp.]
MPPRVVLTPRVTSSDGHWGMVTASTAEYACGEQSAKYAAGQLEPDNDFAGLYFRRNGMGDSDAIQSESI